MSKVKVSSYCNLKVGICILTIHISLALLVIQYIYTFHSFWPPNSPSTIYPKPPVSFLSSLFAYDNYPHPISHTSRRTASASRTHKSEHSKHTKHKHTNKSKQYNVWLVCTIGFNSSYSFIPYFIEWYKHIGIKPQHFLLNIHINEQYDNLHKVNILLSYLNASNITKYFLWHSPLFTSELKKQRERMLISQEISHSDYILITDVDELQDWNNYGVYNIYHFINKEMIPYQYEYVTGYLIDRFAANATLIDPILPTYNPNISNINVTYPLFKQYPYSCDFTKQIVDGIIDKVCLFKNIYILAGGGRHVMHKRLIKYKHKRLQIKNKNRNTKKIRGDSILRYKPFRLKIHHFKWKKDVVYYLKQRAISYKQNGIVWWKQSQNAVDWLEENRGKRDLNNVSEFSCTYDPVPAVLKTEPIDILLCTDEKDKIPMLTLINSIIYNEKKFRHKLRFHILVLNDTEIYMKEIHKYFGNVLDTVQFEIASVMEHSQCVKYNKLVGKYMHNNDEFRLNDAMNFARFCLPFVFKNVSRGVYLDVDMIVRNSISKLYETYDKHNYIAWSSLIRNASKIIMRHSIGNQTKINFVNEFLIQNLSMKYPTVVNESIDFRKFESLFFNGGVLMFDLDVWRQEHFMEQSLELFRFDKIYKNKFGVRPWVGVTQPIYNLLYVINGHVVGDFGGKWNYIVKDYLNYKCKAAGQWNASVIGLKMAKTSSIVHWAGGCKPWETSNAPLGSLWNKYNPINRQLYV